VLRDKPVDTKLKILISYVPLLRADSRSSTAGLRSAYYELINEVLAHGLKSRVNTFDCYQLSLLASLHPIFDQKQRGFLKKWLNLFETSIVSESKSSSELLSGKFFKSDHFG
jgi:hypothetical protein